MGDAENCKACVALIRRERKRRGARLRIRLNVKRRAAYRFESNENG